LTTLLTRTALLIGCASIAFPAAAETNAEQTGPLVPTPGPVMETEGENILVTGDILYSSEINAVKTPTPIVDIPQSLSITSDEEIIERGFDSLGDIVLYTPGVIQSQGEGHRDAIVFRGVRSTADFFVDGVRDDVQYYRGLYNLEQVEILRGPNALLFGRGGTGGVLNRVTKKGVIGDQFVGYLGAVDTFGAFTGQVDLNFTTSESSALRISAAYENLNNHRDFFDGDRIGFNPTFRAELGPDTIIDLSYEYANHDRFIDRGIPSQDGVPAEQLDDITFGDSEDNFLDFEAHVLRATIQHGFSENVKGNLTVSYGDYDKVYSNLFPVSFDPTTNVVGLDGYIDTTQRENFIASGNLIGEFETGSINHTILLGGEYIDTVNNNDRFNAFFDQTQDDVEFFSVQRPINIVNGAGVNASGSATINTFSDLNDDTEGDIEVFSIYIQDEIEVTDWLNLVIGGRYDSFDITVDNIETFIDTGTTDITTRRDSDFSPRLGVILKPRENISIYGSFSQSFLPRSGEQFADLPDDPATPDDDTLDPNTFENLELGLKWDFMDSLSFTAAIFEIEQSSPQEVSPTIDPVSGIVIDSNAGELIVVDSEVRGFEATLQGDITDRWFFSAGYSYLEGDQVATSDTVINGISIAQGEENGLRLRELPEHTFYLWSTYQITERFGIGGGFTYQDESFADTGNNVTLPDFIRFDAFAYYDVSDSVRLQVNVENLFDEEYFPNAHTANNITVGAPLNARSAITGRF